MAEALLELRGVTKRFGGLVAVADLDLDLNPGEILGLIGPNGAGKTTTFNMIAGRYQPNAGSIRFAGDSIVGLNSSRIAARGIMRTFQHNMPFAGLTVTENVLLGAHTRFATGLGALVCATGTARQAEAAMRRRAEELVEFVGLSAFRNADVTALSFGQGRLLETARGLAGAPRLILFDEPAAGLTPAECVRLADIIRSIAKDGIAVLLIEHDMGFLMPLAHRVVVLNFGRKIADGAADAVRADPAVQEAYLGDPTAFGGAIDKPGAHA